MFRKTDFLSVAKVVAPISLKDGRLSTDRDELFSQHNLLFQRSLLICGIMLETIASTVLN